jgi:hypothetical protein
MSKNRLSDLNDHLFAQLERLGDEALTPEQIENEFKRASAITGIAEQILRHAALQVQAAKIMSDHGNDPAPYLPQVEVNALRPNRMETLNGTKMLSGGKTQ